MLSLAHLEKRYGGGRGTLALQDMSLEVGAHDFVSLLGPSGCGKSTVLKMVAGLLPVTSGRITWQAGTAASAQDIGFVFQEPTLMPWASVFDNVWLPLRLRGVSRASAQARVEEALQAVGLHEFAAALPRELSGGMKMRVSIARALITRPKLLLMDEPFGALDEITRSRLNHDTLQLWQQHGFTTLFVTHSVFEAVFLSRRIVVMAARPGRVLAEIAIDEPYPRPEAFRHSARFGAWCAEVSAALHAADDPHG
ncbi:ABC transporter ATP-binding protein [Rhodoferax koreense]|uniref:ABC transporter ATP-binding protein n=1 Tax=Rhodoferax koreensis TaxID=1842727 RepID=UPI001EF5939E|nr:ABC transporter ATP-binding protein [Rhodoferax koreense]